MGRLQKKKTPSNKKKQGADKVISDQVQVAKKTIFSANSAKTSQKKGSNTVVAGSAHQKKNFISKGLQFLREVKIELKKVTWPSRKQTVGSTIVVIVLVMIISIFLGVIDIGLSSLIRLFL